MKKQYDVDVIRDMVKDGNQDGCSISWWANFEHRKDNNDGTFTMFNCEKDSNGDFVAVGLEPVRIPKEAIKACRVSKTLCL